MGQDSGHLQEGWSTTCVPKEDYTEGSTQKSEGTTEAQGCGVPDRSVNTKEQWPQAIYGTPMVPPG